MAGRHFYPVRHGHATSTGLSEVGQRQAVLVGERLRDVPLMEIHHGPLLHTTQTAQLMAAQLGELPVMASDLAVDYVPYKPPAETVPCEYATFLGVCEQFLVPWPW